MEELSDALLSADENDAAVERPVDKNGFPVAEEPGDVADSAVSVCLVGESVFAAGKSEPGTGSAAAAELENEPGSSVAKPVGVPLFEAALKSVAESGFAAAVVSVGEPCSASGSSA